MDDDEFIEKLRDMLGTCFTTTVHYISNVHVILRNLFCPTLTVTYIPLTFYIFPGGDEFDEKVKKFMKKNAKPVVKMCSGEDIGSLEAYDIFKAYLALYEDQLEDFKEDVGCTASELKNRLEKIMNSNLMARFMIKYLLMAFEFKSFVDYCKVYADDEGGDSDTMKDEDEEGGWKEGRGRGVRRKGEYER